MAPAHRAWGLNTAGVLAARTIEAATSAAVFLAFVQQVLIPALRQHKPDTLIVRDNLSAHKRADVLAALAGFTVGFLPRYSPDLSPIEPGWSKLKTMLRTREARSVEALERELGPALDAITADDAKAWFRHCGDKGLN